MHWRTHDQEIDAHYDHAHSVMDILIKGGMDEKQAKEAVERLWARGRAEGYEDAMYDAHDHD